HTELVCNICPGRQDAANAAGRGLVGNRTVGNCEMRLLDETMTIDLELDVLVPSGRTAVERGINQRPKNVPNLAPALMDRLSQRPRVLVPEDGAVRVVVNRYVFRSPPQQHRKAVGEEKGDHHPESRGPRLDWPDRRRTPVLGTDQAAHLAAPLKPGVRRIQLNVDPRAPARHANIRFYRWRRR